LGVEVIMATPNKKPRTGMVPVADVLYDMMDSGELGASHTRKSKTFEEALAKYRDDQAREPKGSPGGDRFADEGRGRGALGPGKQAQALLAANEAKQGGRVDPETFKNQLSGEQRQFIAESEAKLKAGIPTHALVSQGGYRRSDDTWTPERQQLHARIIRSYIEKGLENAVPGEGETPTAILLGGRGGSGKTTATMDLIPNTEKFLTINADDVKAMLPEYQGWNSGLLHEESSMITDQVERIARDLGLNVIYDATMRTSAVKRMQDYQNAGYDVDGYFVHTTPYVSAERAMARALKSGRYVPPEYVLGSRSNEATFDAIKSGMRSWTLLDNNGSKARVVARGGTG
jgi:predicted ABC-type ATPase